MKKIFLLLIFWVFPVLGATTPTDIVVLRGMDKVTGRVQELSFPVGTSIDFGELTITVDKCLTKTPEETPENAAFLQIVQNDTELFKGWMFSSNPAISAMEDAVYDIWVVACSFEPKVVQADETVLENNSKIESLEIMDTEIIED